jgi:hypothetical protein
VSSQNAAVTFRVQFRPLSVGQKGTCSRLDATTSGASIESRSTGLRILARCVRSSARDFPRGVSRCRAAGGERLLGVEPTPTGGPGYLFPWVSYDVLAALGDSDGATTTEPRLSRGIRITRSTSWDPFLAVTTNRVLVFVRGRAKVWTRKEGREIPRPSFRSVYCFVSVCLEHRVRGLGRNSIPDAGRRRVVRPVRVGGGVELKGDNDTQSTCLAAVAGVARSTVADRKRVLVGR